MGHRHCKVPVGKLAAIYRADSETSLESCPEESDSQALDHLE